MRKQMMVYIAGWIVTIGLFASMVSTAVAETSAPSFIKAKSIYTLEVRGYVGKYEVLEVDKTGWIRVRGISFYKGEVFWVNLNSLHYVVEGS